MSSGVTIFPSSVIWTEKRRELMSDVSYLINNEITHKHYHEYYHPMSLYLIRSADIYNKLTIFLLAKTLLRYSDITRFDLYSAIDNEKFFITQKKTKQPISIPFIIYEKKLKSILFWNEEHIVISQYDSVRNTIKKLTRGWQFKYPEHCNNKTHIFRHLQASFLSEKGLSKKEIAKLLGHQNLNSTSYYIHNL